MKLYSQDHEEDENGDLIKVEELWEWLKQFHTAHEAFCKIYDPRFKFEGLVLERHQIKEIFTLPEKPWLDELKFVDGTVATQAGVWQDGKLRYFDEGLMAALKEYL